jgi:hypothetical protein
VCCNTPMGAHDTGLTIETTRDAALIADIHLRTVAVAYQTFFPPDSPAPRAADLTLLWEERLKDSTATAFAASVDGDVVGTVRSARILTSIQRVSSSDFTSCLVLGDGVSVVPCTTER